MASACESRMAVAWKLQRCSLFASAVRFALLGFVSGYLAESIVVPIKCGIPWFSS
jgi:hypothetical protein